MIGIIDYKVGNIASLQFALNDLNLEYILSSDFSILSRCEQLILPGVGHAQYAMQRLIDLRLVDFIKNCDKALLGICLGMQLLFESSEESEIPLLGIIPGRLQRFKQKKMPTTHMGWNRLSTGEMMYFVHSYRADISEYTVDTAVYGEQFTATMQKDQFYGVQFHPEKSGRSGLNYLNRILRESVIC